MRRVVLALGVVAVVAALPAQGSESRAPIRDGGTFRISFRFLDYVDPALAYFGHSWALLDTTCARLMTYPDKTPPEGFRLVPEVATRYPRVSHDRKTWTFTLRSGFRFSNGIPVRASAFARAINRTLAPGMDSPGAQYTRDIAGAAGVLAGKRSAATGVIARGNSLVVRFTRPVPDFAAQTAMPFFCAVPPALPADPEGIHAFPGAGPYYVAEYVPGERVVLRRNRFYRGTRPHHVDRFVVDLQASSSDEVIDRIEQGRADWGFAGVAPRYFTPEQALVEKYGINRSQFFVKPGLTLQGYALNTSRPLFRNNARLRRAVNFAIDRAALRRAAGSVHASVLADQYLPPSMPGFRDARIYPLRRPDLRTARALARGHTRSGKAVLYVFDQPDRVALAQIVKRDLARIGLEAEIKPIPSGSYFGRLAAPNEPYDIAYFNWSADYIDPYSYVNVLFDGRFIGAQNTARFDSARYNRLMRRAARLQGLARYRAYGRLDVQLARDAAPFVATEYFNTPTLVSKRVDPRCIVLRPGLDLTAVCLKP